MDWVISAPQNEKKQYIVIPLFHFCDLSNYLEEIQTQVIAMTDPFKRGQKTSNHMIALKSYNKKYQPYEAFLN